jgi:hypothetical protein
MNDIELYNKYLKKLTYEIIEPFPPTELGPVNVKLEVLGNREYFHLGEKKDTIIYRVTLLDEGPVNQFVNYLLSGRNKIEIHTYDSKFFGITNKTDKLLEEFLQMFGDKRPAQCVELINNYDEMKNRINENLITESKHDTLVGAIVKDILIELKGFVFSNLKDVEISLPEEDDYYHTPFIEGESFPFYIELFLFKEDRDKYKIDADAPSSMDENNLSIAIYLNPKTFKEEIEEIKNNLFYTVRHEYEHLIQTIYDNQNISYPKTHKYKKDSLRTLLKRQEIEPQLRGYFLQSKKERKPFDTVIKNHLDKLEANRQINLLSPERKNIVVKILVDYAKELKLPIKLSDKNY